MSKSLVLNYQFNDDIRDIEKEFSDLTALAVWLHGQRESDFAWIDLYDNNIDDFTVNGWSDICQYIRENTGAVKWPVPVDNVINRELIPDVCPAVCTHGRGLNCPECWPNSKSASVALRALELNLPVIDIGMSGLPTVERFSELPDGTLFYLAQTYAYGGRQVLQKTLEDGGPHNAVYVKDTNAAMTVPDMQLVFRA